MEPVRSDWRQIIRHYLVAWSAPLTVVVLIGLLTYLQDVNRALANQLELPLLLLTAAAICIAFVVLLAAMFGRSSSGSGAPRNPAIYTPQETPIMAELAETSSTNALPVVAAPQHLAPPQAASSGTSTALVVVVSVVTVFAVLLMLACAGFAFQVLFFMPGN